MAKGRKTAALLGLLGAGALAARAVPLDSVSRAVPLDSVSRAVPLDSVHKKTELEARIPEYPLPTDDQRKAARKKLYENEPGFRGALRTEDYQPILSGSGLTWRSGMKKGGKVSASSRADGIAQRGKTKGRMR